MDPVCTLGVEFWWHVNSPDLARRIDAICADTCTAGQILSGALDSKCLSAGFILAHVYRNELTTISQQK